MCVCQRQTNIMCCCNAKARERERAEKNVDAFAHRGTQAMADSTHPPCPCMSVCICPYAVRAYAYGSSSDGYVQNGFDSVFALMPRIEVAKCRSSSSSNSRTAELCQNAGRKSAAWFAVTTLARISRRWAAKTASKYKSDHSRWCFPHGISILFPKSTKCIHGPVTIQNYPNCVLSCPIRNPISNDYYIGFFTPCSCCMDWPPTMGFVFCFFCHVHAWVSRRCPNDKKSAIIIQYTPMGHII